MSSSSVENTSKMSSEISNVINSKNSEIPAIGKKELKGLEIAGIVLLVVGAVIALASGAFIPLALTGMLGLGAALVMPVVQALAGGVLLGLILLFSGMAMKKIGANKETEVVDDKKFLSSENIIITEDDIQSQSESGTTGDLFNTSKESSS